MSPARAHQQEGRAAQAPSRARTHTHARPHTQQGCQLALSTRLHSACVRPCLSSAHVCTGAHTLPQAAQTSILTLPPHLLPHESSVTAAVPHESPPLLSRQVTITRAAPAHLPAPPPYASLLRPQLLAACFSAVAAAVHAPLDACLAEAREAKPEPAGEVCCKVGRVALRCLHACLPRCPPGLSLTTVPAAHVCVHLFVCARRFCAGPWPARTRILAVLVCMLTVID